MATVGMPESVRLMSLRALPLGPPVGQAGAMNSSQAVVVYGATGHTGRFIVAELVRRGLTPIVSGRDRARLDELAEEWPGAIVRPATVDDPGSLDLALAG